MSKEGLKEVEKYLRFEHAKQYHGTDDDMVDAFDDWLCNLEVDDWIELMSDYTRSTPPFEEEAVIKFFRQFTFEEWEMGCKYNFVDDLDALLTGEDGNHYGGKELAKAICRHFSAPRIDVDKKIAEFREQFLPSTMDESRNGQWKPYMNEWMEKLESWLRTALTEGER